MEHSGEIRWEKTELNVAKAAKIKRIVLADSDYTPQSAADLGPEYVATGLPIDIVWAIRNVYVKQKIVQRHVTIMSRRREILAEYDNIANSATANSASTSSADICTMSQKWNYPPKYLFRAIITWQGRLNGRQITDLFTKGDTSPLETRDLQQYERAVACDASPSEYAVAADAQDREDGFVSRFAAFPHRTQLELAIEQTQEHGRPVTTPDILFTPPITINGESVAWIDYKAYVGVPGTFIASKIRKQVRRYRTAYGPGAVVFRYGYVQGMIKAVGALCLDERTCPLPIPAVADTTATDAARDV